MTLENYNYMEDWNFKQFIGMMLMFFSGLLGVMAVEILLCTFLGNEVACGIFLVLAMITGIWLWKSGSRDNNKKY